MTDALNPLHNSAFMQAFLDLVIPPSRDGKRPGAGSLGLASNLAGAIGADDRLAQVVTAGLRAVREAATARDRGGLPELSPEDGREVIDSALVEHPFLMMGVARYLYLDYYQHPRVLEALGEPARPPFPEGYEVEPTDQRLMEALRGRRQEQ